MKKMTKVLLTVSILASAAVADDCQTWRWNNAAFEMDTCAYDNRGSGYIVLRNLTSHDMKTCWTITFNDGRTSKGCNNSLSPDDEPRSSCHSCGTKGVRNVELRKFEKSNY